MECGGVTLKTPTIQSCPNCASHIVGDVSQAKKGNHSQPHPATILRFE